jgi:hypothetical protein
LIRQAAEAGYSDLENIKKDPDLNALRERPDFKKLVADLEKKAPAKVSPAPMPPPLVVKP